MQTNITRHQNHLRQLIDIYVRRIAAAHRYKLTLFFDPELALHVEYRTDHRIKRQHEARQLLKALMYNADENTRQNKRTRSYKHHDQRGRRSTKKPS